MAIKQWIIDQFYGGINDSEKSLVRSTSYQEKDYHFGAAQNGNILTDTSQFTTQPGAVKESGTIITDLPKWIVSGAPYDTNTYAIDASGNIYKRTSAGTWSSIRAVSNCKGQGLEVFNDYLYYTQNTQIGRYGPLSGSPAFTDNWQTGLTDTSGLGFAPIKQFSTGFVVGHGSTISFYDDSVWTLAKLTLPPGVKMRSLERLDEYVVMGTVANNSIQNGGLGYLFLWDGVSQTFNYYTMMDGGVNATLNNKNRLISVAGAGGQLYVDQSPAKKLAKIPKLKAVNYLAVYPGAVCNFQELATIGIAGESDSTDIVRGVYQWGARSDAYPEGLNMAFTLSSGNITSSTIGALCSIGNALLVGWKDGTAQGVDIIARTANPYPTSTLESVLLDDGRPADDKLMMTIKATHLPLVSGESIQLGFQFDRSGAYTMSIANSTVGSIVTTLPVPRGRHKVAKVMAQLNSATATAPTVTSLGAALDDLVAEESY